MKIEKRRPDDRVIALVGNPNVGKSTIFNALTGMNQHTGNWPGKTVAVAQGRYTYKGHNYILVDLPGTYSLNSHSEEERVTVEFLRSGQADCVLVIGDATCLERNLNLILQVMQQTDTLAVCVNLLDEADRTGLTIDLQELERQLGVPVVGTSASCGEGLPKLQETIRGLTDGFLPLHPMKLQMTTGTETEYLADRINQRAAQIAKQVILGKYRRRRYPLDELVLGKWSGRVIMVILLLLVFWLTIQGANVPSMLLQRAFDWLGGHLRQWCRILPLWMTGLLLDGIYATTARVVSVMLPPMAIFFPLFTLLEDFGYLPRAAFLMDHSFQHCGSCGKQVLTMSMGLGCNAAGVMGCRIIASGKERLIAILTNAMVPCNGRFPTLITLIALFFSQSSLVGAGMLTMVILLGVGMTCLASSLLSKTVLRDEKSQFILELPPYRKPRIWQVLVRSMWDRIAFVLGRALVVAAPAGALLWILQNIQIGQQSLLLWTAERLESTGQFLGLNGVILLAFILAFPANELFLPLVLMMLQGSGLEDTALPMVGQVLTANGWTWKTALCVMVFMLLHWPCGTTCLTIRRETGSWRWTAVAILLPTLLGAALCALLGLL